MSGAHLIVRLCQGKVDREYHRNHEYILSIYTHGVLCSIFTGRRDNRIGEEANGLAH